MHKIKVKYISLSLCKIYTEIFFNAIFSLLYKKDVVLKRFNRLKLMK